MMTETRTPRTQQHWAEAVAECVTDEQEALRLVGMYEEDEWPSAMLDIGRALLATRHELTAERAARERAEAKRDVLRAENDTLRGLLGNSGKPCAHCGLPVERWGECALGFPGCARADDAQLSDLFAIGAALAEAEAERVRAEAERDALAEALVDVLADITTDAEQWAEGSSVYRARAALAALERGDGKEANRG